MAWSPIHSQVFGGEGEGGMRLPYTIKLAICKTQQLSVQVEPRVEKPDIDKHQEHEPAHTGVQERGEDMHAAVGARQRDVFLIVAEYIET